MFVIVVLFFFSFIGHEEEKLVFLFDDPTIGSIDLLFLRYDKIRLIKTQRVMIITLYEIDNDHVIEMKDEISLYYVNKTFHRFEPSKR